jgi:hypothetical protein
MAPPIAGATPPPKDLARADDAPQSQKNETSRADSVVDGPRYQRNGPSENSDTTKHKRTTSAQSRWHGAQTPVLPLQRQHRRIRRRSRSETPGTRIVR